MAQESRAQELRALGQSENCRVDLAVNGRVGTQWGRLGDG
jgi:hypothetical protein